MAHKRHVKGRARNSFGKCLAALRRARGFSIRECATSIGVSKTQWGEVELGNREPFEEHQLAAITRELRLTASESVSLRVAAARTRGWYALPSAALTDDQHAFAVELVERWDTLSADEIRRMRRVLTT